MPRAPCGSWRTASSNLVPWACTSPTRPRVRLMRNRFTSNGRAGLVLLDRSSASANHNRFEGNRGPGVQVGELSAATLLGNRFSGNDAYDVDPICGGGGSVDVRAGNTFLGPAQPRRSCE